MTYAFDPEDFAEKLKSLMGNMGQRELARRAGVRQASINALVNASAANPSVEVIVRIGRALGVDANEMVALMGLGPDPTPREHADLTPEARRALSRIRVALGGLSETEQRGLARWLSSAFESYVELLQREPRRILAILQEQE